MQETLYTKRKRLLLVAMALLILATGIIIIFSRKWTQAETRVVISFAINIAIFYVMFMHSVWQRPFSFDMMFWLFNLYFFGFVPLLQHATGVYTWNLKPIPEQIEAVNILVLLWCMCFLFGKQLLTLLAGNLKLRSLRENILKRGTDIKDKFVKRVAFSQNGKIASTITAIRKVVSNIADNLLNIPIKGRSSSARFKRGLQRICRRLRAQLGARDITTKRLDLLLIVSVLITIYHIVSIGFFGLFSRATADMALGSGTASTLLLTHGLKNTVLFTTVFYINRALDEKKVDIRMTISVICLLLTCFPTALSRNMMASFYAGLLIIAIQQSRKGMWFSFAIVAGLTLAFPALDIFRSIGTWESGTILQSMLNSIQNSYLVGHYDAHQNTVSALDYVARFGITGGHQLLGALFFFVPRAIWPTKPVGTGHMMITALNQYYFTNVSASLMLEGYVNFGVIGIALFGIVVGLIVALLDRKYWTEKNRWSAIRLIYPFAMFQFFFLLRGDMMSGWAYLVAQVVVGVLLHLFIRGSTGKRWDKTVKPSDE